MNILIIEDDSSIGKTLRQGCQEAGHDVTWAKDGSQGLGQALQGWFDAIVLDILLPELSGLEVLRAFRHQGGRTPVLLLTALGTVDERVEGLRAGADDYLVKPFAFPELLARLDAISRRSSFKPSSTLSAGPLTLDLSSRRVELNSEVVDLSPTEFSILELLLRHTGQVVSRRMLCEHLWDADWEGVTNVIEVHITRLRAKLDRASGAKLIETVRGRGYAVRSFAEGQ